MKEGYLLDHIGSVFNSFATIRAGRPDLAQNKVNIIPFLS